MIANGALLTGLAIAHPAAEPPKGGIVRSVLFADQFFSESVTLLLPGFAVALLVCAFRPRLGVILGMVLLSLPVAWYYLDRILVSRAGFRLVSVKAGELLWPVLLNLSDYLLNIQQFSLQFGAFVLLQAFFVVLASRLSSRLSLARRQAWLVPGMVLFMLMTIAYSTYAVYGQKDLLATGGPHPLYITGLFDLKPAARPTPFDRRCIGHMVNCDSKIDAFMERYNQLDVAGPSIARHPDILLIVCESFRPAGISPQSAPNLTAFAAKSLVSPYHLSSGNGTHLGYFGLFFGINALWYDRAIMEGLTMKPALPKLLGELGYVRGFVGSWSLEWMNMFRFLSDQQFELREMLPMEDGYQKGDQRAIDRTLEILKRQGDYRSLEDQPLFLVLQCNTTHWNFRCDPEDELFTPTINNPLIPVASDDLPTRRIMENRYRNSVHCLDRMLGPLLAFVQKQGVVAIITGDHGESLGEDLSTAHCNELTEAQVRTPLYVHLPNGPAGEIPATTSHLDVLPTLLHYLGATVNDRRLLYGRSLLDERIGEEATPLVLCSCYAEDHRLLRLGKSPETDWYCFLRNPLELDLRFRGRAHPTDQTRT